jgi:hypothetical protein
MPVASALGAAGTSRGLASRYPAGTAIGRRDQRAGYARRSRPTRARGRGFDSHRLHRQACLLSAAHGLSGTDGISAAFPLTGKSARRRPRLLLLVRCGGAISDGSGYRTPRESRRREPLALSSFRAMPYDPPDGKMPAADECRSLGARWRFRLADKRWVQSWRDHHVEYRLPHIGRLHASGACTHPAMQTLASARSRI